MDLACAILLFQRFSWQSRHLQNLLAFVKPKHSYYTSKAQASIWRGGRERRGEKRETLSGLTVINGESLCRRISIRTQKLAQ